MADYLKVSCGPCGHKLKLPNHPGGKVKCTKCKAVLVIPTAEDVEAALPERYAVPAYVPEPAKPAAPPPPERGHETKAVLKDLLGLHLAGPGVDANSSLDDLCNETAVDFEAPPGS